jgi:hypothetical protein
MAETQRDPIHACRGCPRVFDEAEDICAVEGCGFCRRCHHTNYGQPQPHEFNQEDLIAQ